VPMDPLSPCGRGCLSRQAKAGEGVNIHPSIPNIFPSPGSHMLATLSHKRRGSLSA